MRTGPLEAGEIVLLIDRHGRRYLTVLQAGRVQDLRGKIAHDELIGQEEGVVVRNSRGEDFMALRPTLAEYVLLMPRVTTPIYPKDLGQILVVADIFPGARVVEAGTGTGALTMALLRAVGPGGRVYTYDVREEFQVHALRRIEAYLGPQDHLVARVHDIYQGIPDAPVDRVVLDLPEPWRVVPHAAQALPPGGIFASYVPTVPQAHQTEEALRASGAFALIETTETLVRPWNLKGPSVRPAHRMVAHTGFVTVARRVGGRTGARRLPFPPD
ncbi:MAG: tRNA (adenine-N1)-methyltransferase [Armatimonadota bacterium]|nr:tRNA (adenine-N1)-methyltransferase [Armatimonadota bacterium]MDR7439352.1 tRNA (adenine-N1)-methyltransferase [Armatimonadota bacterium]MDR7563191.1 tRNA (adenine-N1)-methyltransferase [Armatimonadota bacterium]MDR7567394.1 tRNA (adenine-N1)-methyltransferase [Armatimonadota bacterium]MDR7602833.1 tRNA (adenine-N1)-methyltransferase [Armatimonadota bacterium]